MIGDREELVKALEALQSSVEALKAEKVEIQNELNILKRESKSDENSTNNQMEMGLEKAEKDVDGEKLGMQSESETLKVERMDCKGEMGSTLAETRKNLEETENAPLVHSVQAAIQIELEAVRDRKTRENPTENSSLVDSVETSIGNIQLGFDTWGQES